MHTTEPISFEQIIYLNKYVKQIASQLAEQNQYGIQSVRRRLNLTNP